MIRDSDKEHTQNKAFRKLDGFRFSGHAKSCQFIAGLDFLTRISISVPCRPGLRAQWSILSSDQALHPLGLLSSLTHLAIVSAVLQMSDKQRINQLRISVMYAPSVACQSSGTRLVALSCLLDFAADMCLPGELVPAFPTNFKSSWNQTGIQVCSLEKSRNIWEPGIPLPTLRS
jgi:hypothetical protein